MAIKTNISWCDSSVNLMMGCQGCELWNPKAGVRQCYAGVLTERYAGRKGWPLSFDQPALFLDRLDEALRWPDLSGKERPDKPWLNGQPRIIFVNDMGDTFTSGLPLDWLAPVLKRMEDSPHQYLFLTKRSRRMADFFGDQELPGNIWPGVTVTGRGSEARIRDLARIESTRRWVSFEPLLSELSADVLYGGSWRCGQCGYLGDRNPPDFFCGSCRGNYPWPDTEGMCPVCGGYEDIYSTCPMCKDAVDYCPTGINVDETVPFWCVVGGESGANHRPMKKDWLIHLMAFCKDVELPIFVKQDSGPRPGLQGRIADSLWVKQFPDLRS